MADEKKKDDAEEPQKKGGMIKPLVLVAVGAILGGAGVVFTLPSGGDGDGKGQPQVPQEPEKVKVKHPDEMKFQFNPQVDSGKAMSALTLKFHYERADTPESEEEVLEYIRLYWDDAKDAILRLLTATHQDTLRDPDRMILLRADLADELTYQLFPEVDGVRIGRVTKVLITDINHF